MSRCSFATFRQAVASLRSRDVVTWLLHFAARFLGVAVQESWQTSSARKSKPLAATGVAAASGEMPLPGSPPPDCCRKHLRVSSGRTTPHCRATPTCAIRKFEFAFSRLHRKGHMAALGDSLRANHRTTAVTQGPAHTPIFSPPLQRDS